MAKQEPPQGSSLLLLLASAILVSSTLLFWLQPLFTKTILPILGGAPSVWNTAMVCFQTLLLAGYWYADRLSTLRSARLQAVIHGLVSAAALAWVWIVPSTLEATANASDHPIRWLLPTLLFHIGLPFFLLSTTSTLMQRWYASMRPHDDVYWLYIVSNTGSMIGVFGFIALIEPLIGLTQQSVFFKYSFLLLTVLLIASAAAYGKRQFTLAAAPTIPLSVSWKQKLRWIALAAVPSSLLLSTTTHITMDIAPVPLLWMLLLGLYLISFMVAFVQWKRLQLITCLKLQTFLCVPLLADFFLDLTSSGGIAVMIWHMAAFFITAIVCHRILYEARPSTDRLTTFYLYLSIGGAVGGWLTTFVAPYLFTSLFEYPLAFAVAFALRPAEIPIRQTWRKDIGIGFAILVGLCASLYLMSPWLHPFNNALIGVLLMLGIFVLKYCFDQEMRPLRLACAFSAAVIAGALLTHLSHKNVEEARNFYGIITIDGTNPDLWSMRHGTTIHGMQYKEGDQHLTPLTYYHPTGPLGDIMRALNTQERPLHFGIIGLGTGSMACYGRKQDAYTFYEINPASITLARDTRYFTFLSKCTPAIDIVEGDARIKLEQEHRRFDYFILDAFTSDAIPVHLLTTQAFALYRQRIKPGGLVIMHISNRYLNLPLVLEAIARKEGLKLKLFAEKDASQERYKQISTWAVMGDEKVIDALPLPDHWQVPMNSFPIQPWTDDYSNILMIMQ